MLNFIGTGSAFYTKPGNTSAFIGKQNSLLLIDCGGTVFHRLMELKLLEGLKQLYIVITHTHPDHVGSLGEVIFYAHYALGIIPKLYFPDRELMETFFKCIGVDEKKAEIKSDFEAVISDSELGDYKLSFMPVSHVDSIPAFGFILEGEGARIYYSGDANGIPEKVLMMLKEGKLDMLYLDTCGIDYDGNAHLYLGKLSGLIPEGLRQKVCCIHHDSFLDLEQVKAYGFRVAERYK